MQPVKDICETAPETPGWEAGTPGLRAVNAGVGPG